MVELGGKGRALLELARNDHTPTDEDRARVRMVLARRLGAAAGFGAAASLASSANAAAATTGAGIGVTSAGATFGTTLATKLIVVLVAGAAVGGGATAVHRARRAAVVRTSVALAAPTGAGRRKPAVMPKVEVVASADEQHDVAVTPPPSRPDGIVARRRPVAPDHSAPATATVPPERGNDLVAPPPAKATAPDLGKEARLIHDGVAALRAGQPAWALALFDAHAALYPDGALAAECAAERALALAALGRVGEAYAAAETFWRAHPASPLGARLRKRLRALDAGDVTSPNQE